MPRGQINKDEMKCFIFELKYQVDSDEGYPGEKEIVQKYNVTATPVLIVTSPNGNLLEKKTGGLEITQNIRKLFDQYAKS